MRSERSEGDAFLENKPREPCDRRRTFQDQNFWNLSIEDPRSRPRSFRERETMSVYLFWLVSKWVITPLPPSILQNCANQKPWRKTGRIHQMKENKIIIRAEFLMSAVIEMLTCQSGPWGSVTNPPWSHKSMKCTKEGSLVIPHVVPVGSSSFVKIENWKPIIIRVFAKHIIQTLVMYYSAISLDWGRPASHNFSPSFHRALKSSSNP